MSAKLVAVPSRPTAAQVAKARERLIFALDVSTWSEAGPLVRQLKDHVGMFKVGKQLFLREGPRILERIRSRGGEVFLDLKFHDIPQTVARASVEATRLGAFMFNVHASGSAPMMREAVRQVRRACRTEQLRRPLMLAVTVLTSLSAGDLATVGVDAGGGEVLAGGDDLQECAGAVIDAAAHAACVVSRALAGGHNRRTAPRRGCAARRQRRSSLRSR